MWRRVYRLTVSYLYQNTEKDGGQKQETVVYKQEPKLFPVGFQDIPALKRGKSKFKTLKCWFYIFSFCLENWDVNHF